MAVVTFTGPPGTPGGEVGVLVARLLNADYVDRLILAEAAKRIGSTVEVLEIKERRTIQFKDRLAHFFQSMLERSAMSGAGGEPYFSPGMEYLPSEEYTDLAQEPRTAAQRLNDQHFIEVTSTVITELARSGNVVIIGRGSCMILKDVPDAFHVAMVEPLEQRIRRIMKTEHVDAKEAEEHIDDMEKARISYYRKFFKVHPDDPSLYHMVLNLGALDVKAAAEIVARAAEKVALEPDPIPG